MKCVNCGSENPEGAKYCNSCGKEVDVRKDNVLLEDYMRLRNKIIEHKNWTIGYIVWLLINCSLLLFGGSKVNDYFFPFDGDVVEYDFSEFFIYVVVLPVLVLVVRYYIKRYKAKHDN